MLATDAMPVPEPSSAYVEEVEFHLPITTEEALRDFVECAWGVRFPNNPVCRSQGKANHDTPWEFFRDAYFSEHPVALAKASRQLGGKSHLMATLGNTWAVTHPRCEVAILGGSGVQAERVHESMAEGWANESAPKYLLEHEPGAEKTRLRNRSKITCQTASTKSVRGPHPQKMLLDEIDEMESQIFWSAMGQPATKHGIKSGVAGASTHHYDAGTFEELLDIAEDEPWRGWKVYQWCYHETREANGGWATEDAIRDLRSRMSIEDWDKEVELQRPEKGLRAFSMFSRKVHVTKEPIGISLDLPIFVGVDFAYLRWAWVAFQIYPNGLVAVFDGDLWNQTSTHHAAKTLAEKPWASRVAIIGCDPAGNAHHSSNREGLTDVEQIDEAFGRRLAAFVTQSPFDSPEWRAKQIRALVCDANLESHLLISPVCRHLIKGMSKITMNEITEKLVKGEELDDPIDALGYGLNCALWTKAPTSWKRPRARVVA